MRCRKTSGKFRNAKHDPASYTGEAQENRCRQRPSAKREKNNYQKSTDRGARSPVSSASREANARQRKPGFRQSRPDERSVAKVAGALGSSLTITAGRRHGGLRPDRKKSNGPFTSRLYFVSTSAHTTSGDSRSPPQWKFAASSVLPVPL